MKVKELMTTDVVTVTPDTTLKHVAEVLAGRGVSGVPVVDPTGRVVGVISEADVLLKERGPTDEHGVFARFREPRDSTATSKAAARFAREAMTSPAIMIGAERPISAAARMMIEGGVNRLPVTKDGELVGIVTRADLVRAFTRPDDLVAEEIRIDVIERAMWLPVDQVEVTVRDGDVELAGMVPTRTDAEVLERLVARVLGVVSVSSQIRWERELPEALVR
jgi:CBS domain-containing protein